MFTGTIKVEICEASGLRATDKQRKFWQDESPILDPYVQLDIDEKYLNTSSTKPKTFDPVWNECFTHEVHNAVLLGITVFHNAALQPDDFVANCSIPFEELVQRDNETADIWARIIYYYCLWCFIFNLVIIIELLVMYSVTCLF